MLLHASASQVCKGRPPLIKRGYFGVGIFIENVCKLPIPDILGELPQAQGFEINQRVSDFFFFFKQENPFFKEYLN